MANKKHPSLGFMALMFLVLCEVAVARVLTPQEVGKKALEATVILVMEGANGQALSVGSGFFVQPNQIATNFHVVEGAARGTARVVGQKTKYTVEGFTAVDEKHDLAILHVPDAGVQPLSLGDSDAVVVGDICYVAGNPKGFLEGTFSQGIISSIRFEGMEKLIQLTAPISSGSSGGPVLNDKSEVIGAAVAQIKDGQNLNFAIPSNFLDAMIRYMKGNAKYELGLYQPAIEYYDSAIRLNPDNVLGYIWRGFARYELGQHAAARQDCFTVRGLKSRIRIQIHFGSRKKNERQLAYEITEIEAAIRLTPNNPLVHFWLGFLNNDRAEYAAALADCDAAIQLLPDFALAYDSRATARVGLTQYFDAISDYDAAIRLQPDFAEAYGNRGLAKEQLGQHRAAISDYDAFIQLKPDYAIAYVGRGIAKDVLGQRNAALADYEAAILLKPDYAEVLVHRGFAKILSGQYYDGIKDYNTVIRLVQAGGRISRRRGVAKTKLGPYSALIADLDEEIQRKPNFAEAWAGRGWAKAQLKNYRGALKDYDTAIRIKPDFALAYFSRGLMKYSQSGHLSRAAKRDLQTALKLAERAGNDKLRALVEEKMRD